MRPALMLAGIGAFQSPKTALREQEFFTAQANSHRERGDDPHLQSCRAIARYHIHATDGDIGHLEGLIVDDRTWVIRYLVVDTSDWWLGHKVLVPPQWIVDVSWLEATVAVDLDRESIKGAPGYDGQTPPDRMQEAAIYAHYGRPGHFLEELT